MTTPDPTEPIVPPTAPDAVDDHSTRAGLSTPYTSVPATPAGYSLTRSQDTVPLEPEVTEAAAQADEPAQPAAPVDQPEPVEGGLARDEASAPAASSDGVSAHAWSVPSAPSTPSGQPAQSTAPLGPAQGLDHTDPFAPPAQVPTQAAQPPTDQFAAWPDQAHAAAQTQPAAWSTGAEQDTAPAPGDYALADAQATSPQYLSYPMAAGAAASGAGASHGGQPPYITYPSASQSDADAAGEGKRRRRRARSGPTWGGVIATSLATALLASGGTVAAVHAIDARTPTTTTISTSSGGSTRTVSSTGSAPDWEAVTDAVANSVVSITVATRSGTAVGSGVIYDSAGHIITNNHVVSGATQIQVTLADGRIYDAELTGTDPATDLAVIALKNAPSNLTVAQFGDSSQVVTGEDVMAIGNPLGLSSTVTTGIVSAVNRPVVTTQEEESDSSEDSQLGSLPGGLGELLRPQTTSQSQTYTNAIQIDAAINPGNSGGPLFDETGKVIGITSSIAQVSEESGSIGLGFAIPGNLAVKVADQLIASGTATHAYLGVTIADGGAQAGDEVRAGAKVGQVEADSPAAKAGLEQGDVIIAVDGQATAQAAALTGFIRQYSAGDTVTLTVVRDSQTIEVKVVLAERGDS